MARRAPPTAAVTTLRTALRVTTESSKRRWASISAKALEPATSSTVVPGLPRQAGGMGQGGAVHRDQHRGLPVQAGAEALLRPGPVHGGQLPRGTEVPMASTGMGHRAIRSGFHPLSPRTAIPSKSGCAWPRRGAGRWPPGGRPPGTARSTPLASCRTGIHLHHQLRDLLPADVHRLHPLQGPEPGHHAAPETLADLLHGQGGGAEGELQGRVLQGGDGEDPGLGEVGGDLGLGPLDRLGHVPEGPVQVVPRGKEEVDVGASVPGAALQLDDPGNPGQGGLDGLVHALLDHPRGLPGDVADDPDLGIPDLGKELEGHLGQGHRREDHHRPADGSHGQAPLRKGGQEGQERRAHGPHPLSEAATRGSTRRPSGWDRGS
jgi:hypothetical protein